MSKNVALVLASGGSRGLAHIGAIEALIERGYNITSVAGTSMGALVGGLYAAGGLDKFETWMGSVDRWKVFSLMDFTLTTKGFVKGDKIIEELKELVTDRLIEDLPIPYTAVATDIRHRKEVVFERGSLYEAIRASISIPSLFTPHLKDDMILIDGGVLVPLPIDYVKRGKDDILVVVDLNGSYIPEEEKMEGNETEKSSAILKLEEYYSQLKEKVSYLDVIEDKVEHIKEKVDIFLDKADAVVDKYKGEKMLASEAELNQFIESKKQHELNLVEILDRSSGIMTQKIVDLTLKLYPPDILVRIPKNAYSTLEFYKYGEISALGKSLMNEAIDKFEGR